MGKQKKNKQKKTEGEKEENFTLKDYFYINLYFWIFLLVLAVTVFLTTGRQWDPVMKNVFSFIFLVFGGGFSAVTVFDIIYEKLAKKNENK